MSHSYDSFQQRDWTMDVSEGSPVTRPRVGHGASEGSEAGEEKEEQAVNSHRALRSIPRAEAF